MVRKTDKEKKGNLSAEQKEKGSGKDKLKCKNVCGFSEFMDKGETDRSQLV